jgi:hypothetical protein
MNADDQPSGAEPNRGRLVAIFSGLAGLGLVIGVGAAQLTAPDEDQGLLGATSATSPTGTPEPSDEPGATAQPSASTTTGTPDYRSIPEDTTSEPGLDFGYLTRVVSKDGTVTLRFDRATFYTGDEAKQRNNGEDPENDYLIENTNPAQRQFTLDPRASIVAVNRLLNQTGQVSRETLTVAEFVANSRRVLTGTTTDLPVWLRHTNGLTGDVTAVAEQYLP